MLGSFLSMMRGVNVMTLGEVRMMRGRFVVAALMMLGGFPVVVGRVLMVVGGLGVMMSSVLRHIIFLSGKGFRMAKLESPAIVGSRRCTRVAST
jgi:hypothetical protein